MRLRNYFALLGLAMLPMLAQAGDCDEAASIARNAASRPQTEWVAEYSRARELCPADPQRHCDEGVALMAAGRYPAAEAAFKNALVVLARINGMKDSRLKILWRLAQNEMYRDRRGEALSGFATAHRYARDNQLILAPWMTAIEMEFDDARDASPLTNAELTSSVRGMRSFGIDPAIDYRINFDRDSDRLSADAEQQMQGIAESLLEGNEPIQIVGHADQTGDKVHNQRLSERRAQQVVRWLTAHHSDMAGRLSAIGKGDAEPKYPGKTPEDLRRNRRVEFVFSAKSN